MREQIRQLMRYAENETERERLTAFLEHGSERKAAKALGIGKSSMHRTLAAVRERAALAGTVPALGVDQHVSDAHQLADLSHHMKLANGETVWLKYKRKQGAPAEQDLERFAKAFLEDVQLAETPPPPEGELDTDMIPWFQIGDAHIGMLAIESQVGHEFNLAIAERELKEAMATLMHRAPNCERCVIQDLGDFTHYQDYKYESESGHRFDYDQAYPEMIEASARIMHFIIETALRKFRYVDVIINQGNHSRSNDVATAIWLRLYYAKNARVHILKNSSVFIPYRMGNTFVLSHHGDKSKPAALADVMASDFSHDWGEAVYRYIDSGHIHHRTVAKELAGVTWESWNQLAPSDKYANDGGWRSRSCLHVALRSRTYGEKGRIRLTAEEVKDRIDKLIPGTTGKKRREVYSV